jgi:hypothetical protein
MALFPQRVNNVRPQATFSARFHGGGRTQQNAHGIIGKTELRQAQLTEKA